MLDNKTIVISDKVKALQSALYYFATEHSFYGTLLQHLPIKFTSQVPTAAITYNPKNEHFEVLLSNDWFCKLKLETRVAVLHHEILHFTNKHLFRFPFMKADNETRKIYNIAGDMAINQYIKHLPNGCEQCPPRKEMLGGKVKCENQDCPGICIDVKDWKLDSGEPFPLLRPMEEYYELIKNNQKNNKQMTDGEGVDTLDQHMWDELSEEEKGKILKKAKEVIKRTIEKTASSHTNVPDGMSDLLQEIETMATSLNCKEILRKAIKQTVCAFDRTSSWKRPNKRYGNYAPGTKTGNLPRLNVYADSSGSISHTEMNVFLGVLEKFMTAGARDCYLGLWHTSLYHKKKFKLRDRFDPEIIQSGGTDVSCVMQDIFETNPDLSVILTDGYFDASDIKVTSEVIWVISEGGQVNHPMKHVGKTFSLTSIK
jgi:predicted metal-dependent peptidase